MSSKAEKSIAQLRINTHSGWVHEQRLLWGSFCLWDSVQISPTELTSLALTSHWLLHKPLKSLQLSSSHVSAASYLISLLQYRPPGLCLKFKLTEAELTCSLTSCVYHYYIYVHTCQGLCAEVRGQLSPFSHSIMRSRNWNYVLRLTEQKLLAAEPPSQTKPAYED